MKKLLIAFSMVGAGALIACATDNSVKPNYTNHQWFAASVQNGAIVTTGGSFQSGSESTVEPTDDGKIGFDSDFENPVQFKLDENTSGKTTDLTRVVFELEASVVTESARPKPEDLTDAKLAFALCTVGSTTNFYYCMGGGSETWTSLDFEKIPDVDESYTLVMRFDDSDTTKKVRFSVALDDEPLVWENSDWLTYEGLENKPQIDFVGCGKLKSMNADQVWIVSSEISFDGGKVTIAEKDATAMGKLVGDDETIEDVLKKLVNQTVTGGAITIDSACKLSTAEAYAIGLIANEGGAMVAKADGTFKVKADAQANVSGGIPVGFVTPLTPNDTTATVTYKLMGSQTGAADSYKTEIVAETTDLSTIKIPTGKVGVGDGQCRYFKIVTTVKLQNAPEN